MRRFVLIIATFGLCFPSWAAAEQFEQLSNRLKQYDQQTSGQQNVQTRRSSAGEETASYQGEPSAEEVYAPGNTNAWLNDGDWDGQDDGCCTDCVRHRGPWRGAWGRAEYLQWWVRGANTPALVTSNPNNGILPSATLLFGNEQINKGGRSGGRFTAGYWFNDCNTTGLEASFLFVGNSADAFTAASNGSPLLARPFFNVLTGQQDANLIAAPDIVIGSVNVTSSRQIYGAEINVREALFVDCCRRIDVVAGYRYFHVGEGLQVATNTTSIDQNNPAIQVGTTFGITDAFNTSNTFNGGQLGLNAQHNEGRWTLDLLAKLALGGMSQHVNINGSTIVTVPNTAPVTNQGGILALASNSGQHDRNRFAVLPEFGANLRYQLSPLWRVNVGYTLLIVSNVVRPGDQIDLRLDPNQFPPPVATGTSPQFAYHESTVWLQGINLGIECDF